VGTPVMLTCCVGSGTESTVAADDDACCKGLGPGQMCPLHKHRRPVHPSASSSQSRCALRATCDPMPGAVMSFSLMDATLSKAESFTIDVARPAPAFVSQSLVSFLVEPANPPPRA
jgi:hypothetical protein